MEKSRSTTSTVRSHFEQHHLFHRTTNPAEFPPKELDRLQQTLAPGILRLQLLQLGTPA